MILLRTISKETQTQNNDIQIFLFALKCGQIMDAWGISPPQLAEHNHYTSKKTKLLKVQFTEYPVKSSFSKNQKNLFLIKQNKEKFEFRLNQNSKRGNF